MIVATVARWGAISPRVAPEGAGRGVAGDAAVSEVERAGGKAGEVVEVDPVMIGAAVRDAVADGGPAIVGLEGG